MIVLRPPVKPGSPEWFARARGQDYATPVVATPEIATAPVALAVPVVRAQKPERPNSNADRDTEMVRLCRGGMTMREIAAQYGVTKERVRQIVRAAGVPRDVTLANDRARRQRALPGRCAHCGRPCRKGKRFCGIGCRSRSRKWTRAALLDHLRLLARMLGCTPGVDDVNRYGPPSHMRYYEEFGSLAAAQVEAGLTPNRRGKPKARVA